MSETTSQAADAQNPDPVVPGVPDPSAPVAAEPQPAAGIGVPAERRLRLWPGVLIVALQWGLITLAQTFAAGTMLQFYAMFMGPMVGAALFALWWLFASRIPWKDRGIVLAVAVVLAVLAMQIAHS